jgi:hypothetical protein
MIRSLWARTSAGARTPALCHHVRCLTDVCAMGGGGEAYRTHLACADVFALGPPDARVAGWSIQAAGRSFSVRNEDSTKLSCRDLMWRWHASSR